ncbi:MAG: hypothetical protein JNM98_18615 [Rhodocyclaceae bacterium]|nr:hypothetical protein [Rhodocyclaceae bacterium]
MIEYGLMPGRYPAIVRAYDQARRACRVEIPGLTDGGDVMPLAEIEYPIGDKSRAGAYTTELEILPGDAVWVAFIGGDPRYPIITGFRNPQAGNSVDWRRWHHANMELLASALMRLIAGGDVLIQSGSKITLQAPEVVLDTPKTTLTGNESVAGGLSVAGAGAATATNITGNVRVQGGIQVQGDINATGSVIDGGGNTNHHSH